ncbi:MAG: hypothetical protein LUB63_00920, partial [Oscillospiraceae bacterium]|nr:hypothetical protein [Oscillospiraceae bacterium]
MESKFTVKEKKRFLLRKHMKDHAFEYVLGIIGPTALIGFLLYLCKAEEILLGICGTLLFYIGRAVYQIYH